MPQSLAKVIVHIVYSTKNREPWLNESELRKDLYAYCSSILSNADCPVIVMGGVEDHVHIMCLLSRKVAIMDMVKTSKTETSKWLKKKQGELEGFGWQAGYGIFSVSESKVNQVRRYITNQEEHHKRYSFQDEFRELCQRHGIDIDERYVWD